MKFIASLLLIVILGYAAFLFAGITPWWIFAAGALAGGWLVPQHPFKSWLAGFLGMGGLWFVLCYVADSANGGILSAKMAGVLYLEGSSIMLMVLSALIGGLVGGMAALTGAFIRKKAA